MSWKGPKSLPHDEPAEQQHAKQYMPVGVPECYLWRANTPRAWYSWVGDMPATCRSDAAHGGEDVALRLVIQQAWMTWLTLNGYDIDQCPIQNMFEVWDPRARRPNSSAASSSQVS